MHVHNVSSYAPPGYKLARTEYEEGRTKHVFCRLDEPSTEIALECVPGNAAEERGYLESFRDLHSMPRAENPLGAEPEMLAVEELPRVETVAKFAPAKPARKRS